MAALGDLIELELEPEQRPTAQTFLAEHLGSTEAELPPWTAAIQLGERRRSVVAGDLRHQRAGAAG